MLFFLVLILKCVPSIQGNFEYTEKLVDRLPFDKPENSTKISTIMFEISLAIKKEIHQNGLDDTKCA